MSYEASKFPAYAGSAAKAGKKFLMYVAYDNKWNLVGGLRDTGIEESFDTIDATSKDDDGYSSSVPGLASWSANASMVVKSGNEGDEVIKAWVRNKEIRDAVPALKFAFVDSIDNSYQEGFGIVGTYSTDASYADLITRSVNISGCGPLVEKENFDASLLA